MPKDNVIGKTPVKLKVKEDAKLRQVISTFASDEGSKTSLRLTFVGVESAGTGGENSGIKIYVSTTDHDPTPAADSVHYVGMVSPFGKKVTDDFAIDLSPTLRKLLAQKLWTVDEPLTLRLMVAPVNARKPFGDVRVKQIYLEIPEGKGQ